MFTFCLMISREIVFEFISLKMAAKYLKSLFWYKIVIKTANRSLEENFSKTAPKVLKITIFV